MGSGGIIARLLFNQHIKKKTQMEVSEIISDERRHDMLVGALEGGSNYWYVIKEEGCAMIDDVVKPTNKTCFVDRMWAAIKAGKKIPIHDVEDEDNLLGCISIESIERGEETMLKNQPRHFADIIAENDDAITADVWFQYAVMNELVYG